MKHLLALLLAVLFLAASLFGVQAETISSAKTTIVYPVNGTLNSHQLVVLKWDKLLERGLRKPIPDSANPSTVYDGASRIRVLRIETQISKGQPLELSLIALGTRDTTFPVTAGSPSPIYQTVVVMSPLGS